MGELEIVDNNEEQYDNFYSFLDEDINSNSEFSREINQITKALSEAQGKLTSLSKGEQGHGYKYTSLASTIDVVRPVLQEFGLAVIQLVGNQGNNPAITTILSHESGQYFRSTASMGLIKLPRGNEAQAAGAVYSYLRRYALQAILNLASEDNDASSKTSTSASKAPAKASADKPRQKFRKKNEF